MCNNMEDSLVQDFSAMETKFTLNAAYSDALENKNYSCALSSLIMLANLHLKRREKFVNFFKNY